MVARLNLLWLPGEWQRDRPCQRRHRLCRAARSTHLWNLHAVIPCRRIQYAPPAPAALVVLWLDPRMAAGCIRKERTQAAHPRSAKWTYRGTLPTQSRTRAPARGNVLRVRSWHGDSRTCVVTLKCTNTASRAPALMCFHSLRRVRAAMLPPQARSSPGPPNVPAAVVARRTPLRVGNGNRRPSHLVRDLFGILGERILAGSPELDRQADAAHTVRLVHDALSVINLGSRRGLVVPRRRRRCGGRIVLVPPARPQHHAREFLRRRARRKQIGQTLWVPAPRLQLGGLGRFGCGWLNPLSR